MKRIAMFILVLLVLMGTSIYPTYNRAEGTSMEDLYSVEIETVLAEIPEGTVNILVFTDLHHDPGDEVSVMEDMESVLGRLFASGKIGCLWDLGDLINGHKSTNEQAIALMREVIAMERAVTPEWHHVAGNHDNNIQSTWPGSGELPETEILSVAELNDVLENPEGGEKHSALRSTDYYVDLPTLRVVCITAEYTEFMPETAKWLQEEALATDKEVLVLAHCPTRPEWGFRNDITGGELIEEELKDFIARGGTVIAFIHGHDHGDMISPVTDEDGKILWYEVAVGCARFKAPPEDGTQGMTFQVRNAEDETKLLFDVVCIDQEKRIARFVRFGAGEDREIKY